MVVRTAFILFVFIVITDLVNSTPKYKGKKLENIYGPKISSRWVQQGKAGNKKTDYSYDYVKDDEYNNKNLNENESDIEGNQGSSNENDNAVSENFEDNQYSDDMERVFMNKKISKEYIDYNDFESNRDDSRAEEFKSEETRSMRVGDTFTVQELLPITSRLMKKVLDQNRSKGKGIVSSAKNPKELSDKLFERYFITAKRMVVLQEIDIPGLDALQALAISGEAIELRSPAQSYTESPLNAEGLDNSWIPRCHYKLLSKPVKGSLRHNSKRRRGRVDLTKKLSKNRKLVVNPARKGLTKNNQRRRKTNKGGAINSKMNARSQKKDANEQCQWSYECKDMLLLETCRLHPDCSAHDRSRRTFMGIKIKEDELTESVKRFRRAVGIDIIDEEVEKILEIRFLSLRPQRMKQGVESLADYFNKIVTREQLDGSSTTPRPKVLMSHSKNQSIEKDTANNGMKPENTDISTLSYSEQNTTQTSAEAKKINLRHYNSNLPRPKPVKPPKTTRPKPTPGIRMK